MADKSVGCAENSQLAAKHKRQARLDVGISRAIDEISIQPECSELNRTVEKTGADNRNECFENKVSEDRKEHINTPAKKKNNKIRLSEIEGLKGPIGIDIGTTNIVVAQNNCKSIGTVKQLNAFFAIPYSKIIKQALLKEYVNFIDMNRQFYILGSSAEEFAAMYGAGIRRPVKKGLLNPKEEDSVGVIRAIISSVIGKPEKDGETICFSIPGDPIDKPAASTVFHESVIKMHLQSLGYSPISVNEGLSVVASELPDNNFTGIGVSIGGGMCNICFSYLAVPVEKYSFQKGGDYIDSMVASAVGEPVAKIKAIKEKELDLLVEPRNRIETALHIFYDELFACLAESFQQVFGKSGKIPKTSKKIPVVLSGGSVMPRGCKKKFENALRKVSLPVKISEVRLAEKPVYTTAKGSLKIAEEEGII